MRIIVFFLNLISVSRISSASFCCLRIGCYDYRPLSHLPTPECPGDMHVKFFIATRATKGYGGQVSHRNIPDIYSPDKMTIFTIHGYFGESDGDSMGDMVEKLLQKYDANVIVVDWEQGSRSLYQQAAANTLTVGGESAHLMTSLVNDHGADFDKMWCIGFSLGAHVCGHAGMQTGGRIARVTGLDPAGPKFRNGDVLNGINPSSAQFVDVIHTDGDNLGLTEPRGHVDFYPNGGEDQPGCWFGRKNKILNWIYQTMTCSHSRAWQYFMESLTMEVCDGIFHPCPSPYAHQMGIKGCRVKMGSDADPAIQGVFYLQTRDQQPFYCQSKLRL